MDGARQPSECGEKRTRAETGLLLWMSNVTVLRQLSISGLDNDSLKYKQQISNIIGGHEILKNEWDEAKAN